jgi:hypothetical protein
MLLGVSGLIADSALPGDLSPPLTAVHASAPITQFGAAYLAAD